MIRPFIPSDLDAVMVLWLQTNIEAHPFIPASYWQSNYGAVRLQMPNAAITVYVQHDVVVGFIGLMDDYIAGIFVSATAQSQGIGKALLDHVKSQNTALTLQVYQENARAVRFYKREGFVVANEQVDAHTGALELVMRWSG